MKTSLDTKSIIREENTPTYPIVTTKPVNKSFYSFYLEEHQNVISRRLHFAGSSFGLIGFATALKTGRLSPVLKGIAAGYACACRSLFSRKISPPLLNIRCKALSVTFGCIQIFYVVMSV